MVQDAQPVRIRLENLPPRLAVLALQWHICFLALPVDVSFFALKGNLERMFPSSPNATPLGPSLFHLTCRVALATAHLFEDRCSNLPGGPVAQWIRHWPTEPGIVGSSPTRIILCGLLCGCFCSRRREPSRADTSLAKNPLLTLTRCPRSLSSSMTPYGGGLFI